MKPSDLLKMLESLHPLEHKVLLCFERGESFPQPILLNRSGLDESRLDMASGWLQPKGLLLVKDESITSLVTLTETGKDYLEKGTPEMRIILALREGKQFTVKDVIQTLGHGPLRSELCQWARSGKPVLSGSCRVAFWSSFPGPISRPMSS